MEQKELKTVLIAELGKHGAYVNKYIEKEDGELVFEDSVVLATSSELGYEVFSDCKTESEAWKDFVDAVNRLLDDNGVCDERIREDFLLSCQLRYWNRFSDAWGKIQFCDIADELKEEYPNIRVESASCSDVGVWTVDVEGLQEGEETDAMFKYVEILKRKGGFEDFSYDTDKIGKFWIVCREA